MQRRRFLSAIFGAFEREATPVRPGAALVILAVAATRVHAQVDVLTTQYNLSRTSSNMRETILTRANVNSSQFGLLFSRTVDAPFYAFPLIVTDFELPGVGLRDLLIVATLGNTVYAFDADDPDVNTPYWSVNMGPPQYTVCCYPGPTEGILSTPVIDRATQTIYLTAIVQSDTEANLYLYALDLATGAMKYNSPRMITYTFASGLTATDASTWIQRAGLLLYNNVLYVGTANVLENPLDWHSQEGFIQTFQADNLSVQMDSFETNPTGEGGGFWQAGRGIAADSSGNVFVAVDSGDYNPVVSLAVSVIKFSAGTLSPISWFTPEHWSFLYPSNLDLSANGVTLIPDTNLAFAGGKTGVIYLLDQTNLGGLQTASANTAVQEFQASDGCGITDCAQHLPTAYWPHPRNPYLYVWDIGDYLRAYPFDLAAERFLTKDVTVGTFLPSRTGGMTISSNAGESGTGIVWAATALQDAYSAAVPGTLHAYDANDITTELYNSDQVPTRDAMGTFLKMTTPVVANGKVYVNTQSNLVPVYGLLCQANVGSAVTLTSGPLVLIAGSTYQQQVTLLNAGTEAIGGPFTLILSGLSSGATPKGSTGTTSCILPAGDAYIKLTHAPVWLKPGASFVATLEFTLSGTTGITYTPVLVAGSGGQ
jgi:hypothetical protein